MESAIYSGRIRHRRFAPMGHEFVYSVFMIWLDLDELPAVFSKTKLWSSTGTAFVQFRQQDFFGGTGKPLKVFVLDWVYEQTGRRLSGPVRMLANLRVGGYLINPIVCYYLYSDNGQDLEYVVVEVTNTPWGQRQHYLLPCNNSEILPTDKKQKKLIKGEFTKAMHVSPFQSMDMVYKWRLDKPSTHLNVHFDNFKKGEKVFDASLILKREPLTAKSMRNVLWRYPLMTLKVALAIYWQAFKLWRKGAPIYSNPHSRSKKTVTY